MTRLLKTWPEYIRRKSIILRKGNESPLRKKMQIFGGRFADKILGSLTMTNREQIEHVWSWPNQPRRSPALHRLHPLLPVWRGPWRTPPCEADLGVLQSAALGRSSRLLPLPQSPQFPGQSMPVAAGKVKKMRRNLRDLLIFLADFQLNFNCLSLTDLVLPDSHWRVLGGEHGGRLLDNRMMHVVALAVTNRHLKFRFDLFGRMFSKNV